GGRSDDPPPFRCHATGGRGASGSGTRVLRRRRRLQCRLTRRSGRSSRCEGVWEEGLSMRIAVIFGTRPEAIKMAPVVHELRRAVDGRDEVEILVFVTAQHRNMLDQVLALFEIGVDADLDAMRPGQGLADLSARLIEGLDPLLKRTTPDVV